jgi:8-oxo-dGTP pyrophosphatase MutT (NUDIX family)
MTDAEIFRADRLDLRFAPRRWAYADVHRAEIDAHFAAKQRTKPALWNGRVLLAGELRVSAGVCRGEFLETDFASFDAWRDWGRPPAAAIDCFAAVALRTADGAYLLGVMNGHTASAGQIYFPCGTPDPGDVVAGRVDLEYSARRELLEETGLAADEFEAEPGWLVVFAGPVAMLAKLLHARQSAEQLRAKVHSHLASEQRPELADVHLVRGPDDFRPTMPSYIAAFFRHMWR